MSTLDGLQVEGCPLDDEARVNAGLAGAVRRGRHTETAVVRRTGGQLQQ